MSARPEEGTSPGRSPPRPRLGRRTPPLPRLDVDRRPAKTLEEAAERLKAAARRLGFDPVGIAPPTVSERDAEALRSWVAEGLHGAMGYMAADPDARCDARSALEGAAAVLVVALPHEPPRAEEPPPGRGLVSTYAQPRYDYHRVMASRLSLLEELYVELLPGGRARRFCDTTPLLERAFARLAGLGFPGKNTQLIHPRRGSTFFLGGLVLDRPLPPDAPDVTASCGTCTRCLDACPTGAFPRPYVLDARRCISYLTIELRGAVPESLRAEVGAHLFGCDVCQAVCPWNHKFAPPADPLLVPEADRVLPSLRALYEVVRDRFKSVGRGTPWGRAGKRGFLRNLATAMGNAGGADCREPLEELSRHADPAVAEHARWALRRLGERLGKP